LDFGGDVLKFLFGTLTQSDAKKYNKHINELENEQKEFLHISKEQMMVLKSAITSFNITMQKVDKNEKLLADEIRRLSKVVTKEINDVKYQVDSVIILNENIRKVQRGLLNVNIHSRF
jgi:predicted nucleotidyltransferase component of viral defense system